MKRPRAPRTNGRLDNPSEHVIQTRLIDYLAYAAKPEVFYFAIPNQGNRHIYNATKMKAEGVRSGVADLCFMLPDGLAGWLEMKKPGGSLSDTQKKFRDRCALLGHHWALAKSVDEALEILTRWGALRPAYRRDPTMFTTNHLATIQLKQAKGANSGTQA